MYYIVILFSVIFYIISDILFAKHSRTSGVLGLNFFRSLVLLLLQTPFLFFIDFSEVTLEVIIWSLLFGLSGAIYFLSFVYSFKFLPAAIATFILSLESLVVLILSYQIYQEKLSILGYIGAFFLIVSGILLSLKKTQFSHLDSRWYIGIFFAILGMFGGAFWGFGFAYISRETSIFLGLFSAQASIFFWYLLGGVLSKIFFKKHLFSFKISNMKMYIIAAIVYGGANMLYFYATTLGPISLSILFLSFCPFGVALAGHFLLKERLQFLQYILLLFGVIGIFFINF